MVSCSAAPPTCLLAWLPSYGKSRRSFTSNRPSRIRSSSRPSRRLLAAVSMNPSIERHWSIALIKDTEMLFSSRPAPPASLVGVLPHGAYCIDLVDEEEDRLARCRLCEHGLNVFAYRATPARKQIRSGNASEVQPNSPSDALARKVLPMPAGPLRRSRHRISLPARRTRNIPNRSQRRLSGCLPWPISALTLGPPESCWTGLCVNLAVESWSAAAFGYSLWLRFTGAGQAESQPGLASLSFFRNSRPSVEKLRLFYLRLRLWLGGSQGVDPHIQLVDLAL